LSSKGFNSKEMAYSASGSKPDNLTLNVGNILLEKRKA